MRPLFKGKMPHKINPATEQKPRPGSKEEAVTPKKVDFTKEISGKDAFYNVPKDSELSSQGVEIIDM